MTFEELGVRDDLLRGITDMGFETPMPVQEKVIPALLNGDHDLVALARTGTGKTAAFGLPLLQRIDPDRHVPQAPRPGPPRANCVFQIAGDLADFSKYIRPAWWCSPVYGGSSIESDTRPAPGRADYRGYAGAPYRPHKSRRGETRRRTYRGARRGRRDAQHGFRRLHQRHSEPCARGAPHAHVLGHHASRGGEDFQALHARARGNSNRHAQTWAPKTCVTSTIW